jgi:hypothetical protein
MARKKVPSRAARRKAYAKSLKEVKKARKNLDLKLKKHANVISSMFFPF